MVLWSIMTTPNRATSQTPFSLVCGAEAMLPTKLIYGSHRVLAYDEVAQEQLDTYPMYLLFQTLLPLFWTLTCMISMKLTRTDVVFSRTAMMLFYV